MPRVLLTTVCRPLGGPEHGPSVGVDVMKGQLCVNHGAFRTSGVGLAYGLEYIAQNIESPTVVLHWPSHTELARELRRGRYDMVGVSFVMQCIPHLRETVATIRRHAPGAKVILGGYGVAVAEATRCGDLVCRGDGIAWMRDLLGERVGQPIEHPTLVYGNQIFSLPIRAGRKAMVVTGLGCANRCDFCASSHKFDYQYVPYVRSGDELFEIMRRISDLTGVDEFQVFDENFLADLGRAQRFADRCDAEERYFEYVTFASVDTLSGLGADELCRMGISAVWIGLEGKQAGYSKLHGERLSTLCQRLKHHGILVCGSMIIGFDYQTPPIIRQELGEILDAAPTYLQCLMYGPAPGTKLSERIDRQGRWRNGGLGSGVPWGCCDGFALTYQHPSIGPTEMRSLQHECYETDLKRGGFSLYRAVETWLEGYQNLSLAKAPFLQARARIYARKLRACRPLIQVGIQNAPNAANRQRLSTLRRELIRAFGPLSVRERLMERLLFPVAARYTEVKLRHGLSQEPGLLRRAHRCQ